MFVLFFIPVNSSLLWKYFLSFFTARLWITSFVCLHPSLFLLFRALSLHLFSLHHPFILLSFLLSSPLCSLVCFPSLFHLISFFITLFWYFPLPFSFCIYQSRVRYCDKICEICTKFLRKTNLDSKKCLVLFAFSAFLCPFSHFDFMVHLLMLFGLWKFDWEKFKGDSDARKNWLSIFFSKLVQNNWEITGRSRESQTFWDIQHQWVSEDLFYFSQTY